MKTLRRWRAEGGYNWWEQRTDLALSLLAVAFVVALILPLAHPLTSAEAHVLDGANALIWAAFTADYVVRFYLSPRRWEFVRRHPLDLVVVAVPLLRPLRLLRLARLLRLLRVGALVVTATRRSGGRVVRRVTVFVGLVAALVMSTSAVIVYDAERRAEEGNIHSLADAFWWALATVTTVGYGDHYPVSATGRITAGVLMLTGIALAGVITAGIAAWFVNLIGRREDTVDEADLEGRHADPALLEEMGRLIITVESLRSEVLALREELDGIAAPLPAQIRGEATA